LLVIGATGDIGSACARALAPRVTHTLLAARAPARLRSVADALAHGGTSVETVSDLAAAVARADIIVTAASNTVPLRLDGLRPGALVCDAGYPKNIVTSGGGEWPAHVFWGGMGVSRAGIGCDDGMLEVFYRFPVPGVAHGCLLEGVVLALAGRYESYSEGRGAITVARMEEMLALANRFGYTVAPCFNADGVWPTESTANPEPAAPLVRAATA
jgi:predicted amino acid dehydrogenase